MPLYEYWCERCDRYYEDFRSYAERHSSKHACGTVGNKVLSRPSGFHGDVMRDSKGTPIWFPSDGKPYFDRSLQRTFVSKKEKASYMKMNNLIMDGSTDKKNRPVEAGDFRKEKVR